MLSTVYFILLYTYFLCFLKVDWVLNIGEQALDICVISVSQLISSVFVLGERNFFCLKDNGQIRFIKKLDRSPSCFLPYSGMKKRERKLIPYIYLSRSLSTLVSGHTVNTLIGNHNSILHIYQDVTLKWATQLPHIPVAVRVGKLL
ncbi:hypothetical protein JD844_002671 [Phrynosoma platyrhinos]|uniref:PTHB1 N-terminal domain-containing protein n=1 Tax=Phrynosoma platyrhinos TaxID=52577 RepID=A0ABQ7TCL3_PHRPL|nr:hypothetical protein JD844_002671 [Phrynosoma platyrhinos]